MRKIKPFIYVLFLLCLLSACSFGGQPVQQPVTKSEQPSETNTETPPTANSKEQGNSENTREEKISKLKSMIPDDLTKIPVTAGEFTAMPPGRFAGAQYSDHKEEIKEVLKQIPDIENPDSEVIDMYFRVLLGMFGEDYPDPDEIVEEIKLVSFGSPDIEDPRYQFKENYNVEIILDASGSMANTVNGKTRMEAAKAAIKQFAESLPKAANVALRVYGHKGSGKESDKALSCGSSELVYGMQPYSAEKLQQALDKFQPTGYTPIAYSLKEAQKDLAGLDGEKNTNIIYLVSDGIETCDGNPVEAAKELAKSNISPIINVIGFATDGEGQRQLKEVAKAAGGQYVYIQNQKELYQEFKKSEEIARKWFEWHNDNTHRLTGNKVKSSKNIQNFGAKWINRATRENYNINSALFELASMDALSRDIIDELMKRKDEQYDLELKRADEIRAFLNSLNDKTYKEAFDLINKQYSQQGSQ